MIASKNATAASISCNVLIRRSVRKYGHAVPSDTTFDVDDDLQLRNAMPTGPPGQNHPARPNILMFQDFTFAEERSRRQHERYVSFQRDALRDGVAFVVIEIGAGT